MSRNEMPVPVRAVLIAFVSVAATVVMAARFTGCTCQGCHSIYRVLTERRPPPPLPETYTVKVREGVWVTRYRDKIPKDKQVGCDICPFWCTQVDLVSAPMDELIPYYVYQANRYVETHETGDYLVHLDRLGHDLDELDRLACMAAIREPAERARFLELLQHSNLRVRYVAAVHALALGMDADRALATLRALAAEESEVSESAETQLMHHEEEKPIELF